MRGSSEYEVKRAKYIAAIPAGYRWWCHLLFQGGVGLVVAGYALSRMSGWDFGLLPLFLVIANLIEWYYHKNVMHHVFPGLRFATVEHVGEHHSVFVRGVMEVREPKELHAVLLAPLSLFIAYGIMLVPAAVASLLYPPVAYAWVASAALYLVSYETLHTLYHLPIGGVLGNLRKNHEIHHDPLLMQKYNFNVTIPLWDLIMGTYRS
jgi:Fatty acid hydroxylase superfamily